MGPSACRGLLWLAGSCQEEIHCNAGNPVPRGRPVVDSATEDDHRPRWTTIASCGLQDSRVHWELSQTLTGRRKDRVGEPGRNRCRSGFADAARRLRARVAAPATWMVQAPHNPTPQNLVPVMPSTSRKNQSSGGELPVACEVLVTLEIVAGSGSYTPIATRSPLEITALKTGSSSKSSGPSIDSMRASSARARLTRLFTVQPGQPQNLAVSSYESPEAATIMSASRCLGASLARAAQNSLYSA